MGYEAFKTTEISQTIQNSFVNDTGPFYTQNPNPPYDGFWTAGTGHMTSNTTSGKFDTTSGYRSSVSTPGWRSKNRPLLPKANSFTFHKEEWAQSGSHLYGSISNHVNTGPGTAGYSMGSIFTTNIFSKPFLVDDTDLWATRLREEATRKLLEGLKDMSFNAAQAVGERAQTANLVASTATRLAKSYRSLRSGNFAKAARDLGITPPKRAGRRYNKDYATDQAKAAGNAWLELQYGWKPLLSDVYGSMETLAKAQNRPNTIYKKKSGRKKRQERVTVRTPENLGSGSTGSKVLVQSIDKYCEVRVGVTYSITSPVLASMASVGITNPALLAWELLPFSFVADWFFPIGNYLSSLDATLGLSFVDGFVTTYRKSSATSMLSGNYTLSGGSKWYQDLDISSRMYLTNTRSTLGSFPSAPRPRFKNPVSSSHLASAMALLLQTFKR
jgi:hypothetical protein